MLLLPSRNRSFRFVEDMSKLINDTEFSDIKLSARGKEFFAHKSILAGRSPVIREILRFNKEASVICVDVDACVLKKLLQFIYTGCCHRLHQGLAKELIIVAKRYEMDDLENVCIEYLCRKLNVDNAVEIAMFAVCNKLHTLKTKTIERITTEFVKKDADSIMKKLFNVIEDHQS